MFYYNEMMRSITFFELILPRKWKRGRERERESFFLFHLPKHLLLDSCTCSDQESNLPCWHIGMTC